MKCIGVLVIATAGLAFASVAHAGDATVRMAVRYDDLDLAAAKDATILVERLDGAVRRVASAVTAR
ncbi:MAG: UrcA family protein [Alphaproteobacteria bacterium]|nr:UrcA family protein [Alphaproteobacteria bacterium]